MAIKISGKIDEKDAENLLEFIKTATAETDFLANGPEKFSGKDAVKKEQEYISGIKKNKDEIHYYLRDGNKIVGSAEIKRKGNSRSRHVASVGIAILKDYCGKGYGTKLFTALFKAARKRKIEILMLDVVDTNYRAQDLYRKFGFYTCGFKRDVLKLPDGSYHGMYLMECRL